MSQDQIVGQENHKLIPASILLLEYPGDALQLLQRAQQTQTSNEITNNRDIFIYRVCDLYFTGTVIMSVDARFELFHLDIYIFLHS